MKSKLLSRDKREFSWGEGWVRVSHKRSQPAKRGERF